MRKLIAVLTIALTLVACDRESSQTQEPQAADVAAGERFVQEHCIGCHAPDGSGRTAEIPNLAGQPASYLESAMQAYRSGERRHAALQDLIQQCSAADVRNIAAYYASLPPVQPGSGTAGLESDAVYAEGRSMGAACARCHGERGFSTTPGVPNLAGQHPMYLIIATQEYASGARDNAEKEAMLQGLDNVDIEKMAMYFAAQAPELREPPPFGSPVDGQAQTAVCGSCHGARGVSGDPMVPNLAAQEPNYLVQAITAYRDRKRSHEDMMANKSDAEIEDIAAFYAVQPAGAVIADDARTTEIIAKCERCHGRSLGESSMVVPVLHGQNAEYLLRVMQQYRDGERGSSTMHKMSAGYNDRILAEIAEYYATHSKP